MMIRPSRRKGQEEGRAGAHDDGFAVEDGVPHLDALVVVEAGVVDGDLVAEAPLQAADQLGGQGDLGQQVQHLLAAV